MIAAFSVRTRLVVAFAILSSALLIVGLLGMYALGRTQQNLEGIYQARMLPIEWVNKINDAGKTNLLSLDAALIGGDTEHVDALERQFSTSDAESEQLWHEYMQQPHQAGEQIPADAFWNARQTYLTSRQHILGLLRNGQTLVAGSWRNRELQKAFDAQQAPLKELVDLQNQLAEQAYQSAIQRYVVTKIICLIGISCALIAAVLLAVMVIRSMLRSLNVAVKISECIAAGELGQYIHVQSTDEFGRLAAALKQVDSTLAEVTVAVHADAETVGHAAHQLVTGNRTLSNRTREQAAALHQVIVSIDEMTDTLKRNAGSAQVANELAAQARQQAGKGNSVVSRAIEAMSEIDESSDHIAAIIEVIDEIAFQTNLLALNAAVEAARAGEQGRGFAVVAAEVRNLSQRSSSAAKEIKALIADSLAKVKTGTELVSMSGKVLIDIVSDVNKVSALVAEIAQSSDEQTHSIAQLNQAAAQIEKLTIENAGLAEAATITSKAVEQSAEHLIEQVAYFKVASCDASLQSSSLGSSVMETELYTAAA